LPFRLLALEYGAGELFLTIQDDGSSVSGCQLLHVGVDLVYSPEIVDRRIIGSKRFFNGTQTIFFFFSFFPCVMYVLMYLCLCPMDVFCTRGDGMHRICEEGHTEFPNASIGARSCSVSDWHFECRLCSASCKDRVSLSSYTDPSSYWPQI